MRTETYDVIAYTIDAFYALEDVLDRRDALTQDEREMLRRLQRRWDIDTQRKVKRALGVLG